MIPPWPAGQPARRREESVAQTARGEEDPLEREAPCCDAAVPWTLVRGGGRLAREMHPRPLYIYIYVLHYR